MSCGDSTVSASSIESFKLLRDGLENSSIIDFDLIELLFP
jgi:hypothetical protein